MQKLIAMLCLLSAFFTTARSRAADECVAEATDVANAKGDQDAKFFEAADKPATLKLANPCAAGTTCPVVYFARQKLALEVPKGYQPMQDNAAAAPGKFEWTNVVSRSANCKTLLVARFQPSSGATPPPAPPNKATLFRWRPSSRAPAPLRAVDTADKEDVATATTSEDDFMQKSLADYHALRTQQLTGKVASRSTGTSQGLEDVAAEAVQILGQIVVDRASAEGFRLVTTRLKKLLGCDEEKPPIIKEGQLPKPTFPKTCGAIDTLRLEDLATSRDPLVAALLQDVLAYLQQVQASLDPKQLEVEQIGALAVVGSVVTTLLVRPSLPADSPQARLILGTLLSYVDKHFPASATGVFKNEAERAVAAGVLAYTRCDYEAAQNNTKLSDCNFPTYSDAYAGENQATRVAAGALASELLAVATLTDAQGQPDAAARVIHAVDALLASSCMLLNDPATPAFSCPAPPSKLDLAHLTPLVVLELVKPIVDGALDKDSNAVLLATANAVVMVSDAAADAEYIKSRKRAFLLLGALVQYSATYIGQTPGDAAQRHDQRTKILESLTAAMSDRTGREGDGIWSFGGSFRAVAGVRLGAKNPALATPVALPLGIGFDHVSNGDNATFHLELSPLDLGQYVAFDNRGVVKKPKFADVVMPSVTLGVGIGRSLPFVIGATGGYSPAFQLAPTQPGQTAKRGAWTVGLTAGIYVPLIDMN